jgi:predicted Zn-dependent protease
VETDQEKLVKRLQKMLEEGRYRNELATRYALVLALLTNEKTLGVQEHIDWLLKKDGDRVVYRLQQAHLALLQKQKDKAMQLYERALQVYPDDPLLSLDYAEKLLQNNNPERAKVILLALSSQQNSDYYQLLVQSHQMLGNKAEAHLVLAEDFYLHGQTALALSQLKQARQQKGLDFYVAARIEARYQELETLLREEQESSAMGQP